MASACSTASAPQQSAQSAAFSAATAKAATSTSPLPDLEFDGLIADAGVRQAFGSRADEIIGQLERSRAAVVPKPVALTGRASTDAAEQTVLLAANNPSGVAGRAAPLMVDRQALDLLGTYLGAVLQLSLDRFTRGDGGGGSLPPETKTDTEDGATAQTTTSLTMETQVAVSGSRVQLTVHGTWVMKTTDKASGSLLVSIRDDRTLTGAIDVCPSAAGEVPVSLDADIKSDETATGGAVTTRQVVRKTTFTGHVDDQATLRSVSQEQEDQTSWESTSGGSGSSQYSATNINWTGAFDSFDGSAMKETSTSSGDISADQVQSSFASGMVLATVIIEPAIKEAQRLWRNGRCVVVMAPDYNAETPIQTDKQQAIQHDEAVKPKSETKFSIRIKHRFGGALNQPVQASLISGEKKLEPSTIGAVPATLTYTAPDEQDKKAVAQLKTTSKRGIGTLVIAFNTGGKKLTLEIRGTLRTVLPPTPTGPFVLAATADIGPVTFTKKDDVTWEATAPYHGSLGIEQFPVPNNPCPTLATETGTIYLVATIDQRAGVSVWVVKNGDLLRSTVNINFACQDATYQGFSNGGFGGLYMVNLMGDIVIPIDGGTVTVHASDAAGGATHTVDATVTATVGK